MSVDMFRHDYCHCSNKTCTIKDKCFRYTLYLEDIADEDNNWCSYAGFQQDDKGACPDFMQDDEKHKEVGRRCNKLAAYIRNN